MSGVVLHAPEDAGAVAASLAVAGGRWRAIPCGAETGAQSAAILRALLERAPAAKVAYLPCGIDFDEVLLATPELACEPDVITPILPAVDSGTVGSYSWSCPRTGWIAPKELALELAAELAVELAVELAAATFDATPHASRLGLPALIAAVERGGRHWRWNSSHVHTSEATPAASPRGPLMHWRSRVLAVVPHYGCEQWLAQCLHSLTTQTRPPENIVVVDDGSAEPPLDIVRAFPGVTLLATPVNIGPENILHSVIQTMDYDAYMVQDADDWCAANRLQRSLEEAERAGAGVIGAQELRLPTSAEAPHLRLHPLDVNGALANEVAHYLCHGTSLISRAVARRVGGFDMTLQVAADTDFILRSSRVCRIVNLSEAHYYRRMRPGSRTSAANTGQGSVLRARERDFIFERARRPLEPRAQSATAVATLECDSAVEFRHILGPSLRRGGW